MAITLMYYEIECSTLIKLQENIYLLQLKEEKNSMTQGLHSIDTHREMLYGALMSQGRWESCGPFLVKRKITELNYLLQLDASGLERLVHHNKLKPNEGDHPPSWIKRARRKLMRSAKGH